MALQLLKSKHCPNTRKMLKLVRKRRYTPTGSSLNKRMLYLFKIKRR
jgi:hypothetical protein